VGRVPPGQHVLGSSRSIPIAIYQAHLDAE
jgi:hypothetical protein